MTDYKIEDIEGIGPVYGAKLKDAGINKVEQLLEVGCTPKGRKELAGKIDMNPSLVLQWVNMADLFRINGVSSQYAELMKRSGVDTVKELRNRNPENLHAKMAEVNSEGQGFVRQVPGLSQVQKWVLEAKALPPKVTY